MRIESAASMPVSAEMVYAAVADLEKRPRWLREMSNVDAPEKTACRGERFTATSSLLLHRFHGASDVKDARENELLVEEVHLGARFVSTWSIEPTATGATLRHGIDLDLPAGPLGWAARIVLGWRLRRMSRRSLRLLRDQLSRDS